MARIRSIKPEFFKHLELQELECTNPGQNIMLVYAGLWTQCDKNGVFFYNAKVLKNEILPFLEFDMQKTLDILEKEGYFSRFKHERREYGHICNFSKYQFPTKGEKDAPAKYPEPPVSNGGNVTHDVHKDVSEDVLEDITENIPDDVSEAEGIWNLDNRNLEEGKRKTDSGAFAPNECEISDPEKLFLHIWQHNPKVFNIVARIESPKEWQNYWKTAPPTCEEVQIAMDNFIEAVKSGELAPRYVASTPDRFVLKGWITKCQKRFQNKTAPPSGSRSPPAALAGRKSLGGIDDE